MWRCQHKNNRRGGHRQSVRGGRVLIVICREWNRGRREEREKRKKKETEKGTTTCQHVFCSTTSKESKGQRIYHAPKVHTWYLVRKYMYQVQYRNVDLVVSAIEKSDLDQVLSHERPSFEMQSTIRCSACSTCLTLLVSSGGGGLGRARVVSLRGVPFSFFFQNIPTFYSYVQIQINLIYVMQENDGWLKSSLHSLRARGVSLDLIDYNCTAYCCTTYEYTRMYCTYLSCTSSAAASLRVVILLLLQLQCCCLPLLFVIVCRMQNLLLWSIASDSSVSFCSFKHDVLLMYPLAVVQPRFPS